MSDTITNATETATPAICPACAHGEHETYGQPCSCPCHGIDLVTKLERFIAENVCDKCGGSLDAGFDKREHGRPDPQTGYVDVEILCGSCADELEDEEADDLMFDCADDARACREDF